MLLWLTENLATILISAALAAVVALIIISIVRGKKKGKSTCGGGCASCSMSGFCHHGE